VHIYEWYDWGEFEEVGAAYLPENAIFENNPV